MESTISTLPIELLVKIFQSINFSHNERSNVICCLSVCRQWRDCALSVLYGDLVIVGINQLECFLESHDCHAVSSITQSLTIRMSNPGEIYDGSIKQLATRLHRLAAGVIVHMAKLESFSLWAQSHPLKLNNLRSAISSVLQSLPESCVNLELDIGVEWILDADTDMTVCGELRRVLPRMHDVRIRMVPISDTMLGIWDSNQIFHPISLPHMRNLLIYCAIPGRRNENEKKVVWLSLIQALQQVVELEETNSAELVVVGCLQHDLNSRYTYSTLSRCHIRSGDGRSTTWTFPHIYLGRLEDNTKSAFLIRTDIGGFVMTGGSDIAQDIGGGRPWRWLWTGARLSVSSAPRAAWISDQELQVFTEAEWHEKYPNPQLCGLQQRHSQLWSDERKAGIPLLDAEERMDTELRDVMPIMPLGVELDDLVS